MKERIYSDQLHNFYNKEVLVKGHLYQKRVLGKIIFLILRDSNGLIQCIVEDEVEKEKLKSIMDESPLEIEGICKEEKRSPGKCEIHNPRIKILSKVNDPLPIEINKPVINANLDTILDHRAISLRNLKLRSIFKIQSSMAQAYREYMTNIGATEIFIPTIVGSATEGGSELFQIKYYDRNAYLGQSAQLYKQMAIGSFEKVFSIAHSYRAEKFGTSRHTSEFIQYDFEMGFIKSYQDIIGTGINVIKYISQYINKVNKEDIDSLEVSLPTLPEKIPQIKLKEAQEMIFKETGLDERSENDLSPEGERQISKIIKDKHNSDLVIITHYPTSKRPFYTMPDKDNPEDTLSFDFILRGEEITTGSQRINEYDMIVAAIYKKGLKVEDYEDYLEIFKYGMPPEGGFGMGFERLTQQFLNLPNVREATLFPRDVKRLRP